jgi:UDP-sugar transporter A1/2/3
VYQITYQLKILTTAFMSVVLLNMTLNRYQIVSLGLLTTGVAMVQLANTSDGPDTTSSTKQAADGPGSQSAFLGLSCVLLACLTSGFSGVYMEKVLKKGRPVPLFVRNIQLSFLGLVLGLFAVIVSDGRQVAAFGFFQGYNMVVLWVIILQAGGGLMIAVVMKYADNILKGFATSISIVLSTWISTILFDFRLSPLFVLGAAVVMSAVFLYGYQPKKNGAYLPLSIRDAGRNV